MDIIFRLDDIPDFASEDEEADYWGTHTFCDEILAQFRPLTEEEAPRPLPTRSTEGAYPMVRAKFRCNAVLAPEWKGEGRQVHLQAVYGQDGSDNASWSKATPAGQLSMFITNPAAYEAFEEGKEYFITFDPA